MPNKAEGKTLNGISPKKLLEAGHLAKQSAAKLAWRETLTKLCDGLRVVISKMTSIIAPEESGTEREGSQRPGIERRESLSKTTHTNYV